MPKLPSYNRKARSHPKVSLPQKYLLFSSHFFRLSLELCEIKDNLVFECANRTLQFIGSFPMSWFGAIFGFPASEIVPVLKNSYILVEKIRKEKDSEKDQHFMNPFISQALLCFCFYINHLLKSLCSLCQVDCTSSSLRGRKMIVRELNELSEVTHLAMT